MNTENYVQFNTNENKPIAQFADAREDETMNGTELVEFQNTCENGRQHDILNKYQNLQ